MRFRASFLLGAILGSFLSVAVGVVTAHAAFDPYANPLVETAPYNNPIRDAPNLIPAQVDSGVDYRGTGPVYAIADGYIDNTPCFGGCGWPGTSSDNGAYITYTITKGPYTGRQVYVAECIDNSSKLTLHYLVQSGTRLGNVYACNDTKYNCTLCGIEMGWGDPSHFKVPMASGNTNDLPTYYGENFRELLSSLGAPVVGKPSPLTGATVLAKYGWADNPGCPGGTQTDVRSTTASVDYLGVYEYASVSLQRYDRTVSGSPEVCFENVIIMSYSDGSPPPDVAFNINVQLKCNGGYTPGGFHVGFDFRMATYTDYVSTDWFSGCLTPQATNEAGSYGSQVVDSFPTTLNSGRPSGTDNTEVAYP